MQSLVFQTSNILENLYTDGSMNYITTHTIVNMPHQFQSIITYCNTYIPLWQPQYNDTRNRIAYNQDFMIELIFYKNLILAIPLYISTPTNQFKFNLIIAHIISYCEKITSTEDGLDLCLARLLNYKLIFYSPNIIYTHNNLFKTNKTVINTHLHIEMYQSNPILLSNNSIKITNIYDNIIPNYNQNNASYMSIS